MVILDPSPASIERAAAALHQGELVSFPTETVYGLGASALTPAAVAKIFEAKGRPRFDPLICHVADLERSGDVISEMPPTAEKLAERFWPGPLTLVLHKRPNVPDLVTSGLPTVAVRVPAHPVARDLLLGFGGPIAAPSANRFGAVSPTRAEHVEAQLGDAAALILDGGPCQVGVESTIVSLLPGEPPFLLRPGGIPLEDLQAVIGRIEIPKPEERQRSAPGRLAKHYAPSTPLILDGGARPEGAVRVGRLAFREVQDRGAWSAIEVLAPGGTLEEAARNLFAALRRLDSLGLDLIEAEPVPETGLGRAIMDRLRRAEVIGLKTEADGVLLSP